MIRTLFEKVWSSHVVHQENGGPALLYVDLHLVHEVTSPQAFEGLRREGRAVRRPDLALATVDHNVPTTDRALPIADSSVAAPGGVAAQERHRFRASSSSASTRRTRGLST